MFGVQAVDDELLLVLMVSLRGYLFTYNVDVCPPLSAALGLSFRLVCRRTDHFQHLPPNRNIPSAVRWQPSVTSQPMLSLSFSRQHAIILAEN